MERHTTEPLADHELVARIGGGDEAAVSLLHERFSDRIYFIALRETRSAADAEDVRNETLVRVLDAVRKGRLSSAGALPGFVLSTARNVLHELYRQGRRSEPILDRDFTAPASSTETDVETQEAIQLVLRRLKPRECAFLRLFYYDELPKEEISRRLGIPEDRLRLIKSRALKSFREIYERLVK